MQPRKLVATGLSIALLLVASVLGAVQLGQYPDFLGATIPTGFAPNALIVVGQAAATSDVVGAIDLGADLQQLSYVVKTAPGVGVAQVTGGVSLDTADTKLYLSSRLNDAKKVLTSTDLPELLKAGIIEDEAGKKYDYKQYIRLGAKTITYAQPDPVAGLKDPDYLIRLGTTPAVDGANLYQLEVFFDTPIDVSEAIGKEITLFGNTYAFSADSSGKTLVLYGTAAKEVVRAGETKTITVGGRTYTVTVVGMREESAVIEVNGIRKTVSAHQTYEFAGISVYISNLFYYEIPERAGSVELSVGADRLVLADGAKVKVGPKGAEKDIEGTRVALAENVAALSTIKIAVDAYTKTPRVDYIKAGDTFIDPVFKTFKVAYNGPVSVTTETISLVPASANAFSATFTDKYGNSASFSWTYGNATAVYLKDANEYDIHVLEGEALGVNEYTIINAGGFQHLIQITSIGEPTPDGNKVTFRDVITGATYETYATKDGKKYIIDGQEYTFTNATGQKVRITWSASDKRVIYPVLETKYGAKVALTKPLTGIKIDAGTEIILPTGTYTVEDVTTDTTKDITVGGVKYTITIKNESPKDSLSAIRLADTIRPALLLVEKEAKGKTRPDAAIYYVKWDTEKTKVVLETPIYTHASGDIFKEVATSVTSPAVYNTVTLWGTKIVRNTAEQGTITVTFPESQVFHLVALGSDPKFVTTAAGVTYREAEPLVSSIAKLDTELMDTLGNMIDVVAFQNYNIVIVGGPCANILAWKLVRDGKLDASYACGGAAWTAGAAYVIAVENAFATGRIALLVAGTTRAETRLATDVLSQGKIKEAGTASRARITGTVASPIITAV